MFGGDKELYLLHLQDVQTCSGHSKIVKERCKVIYEEVDEKSVWQIGRYLRENGFTGWSSPKASSQISYPLLQSVIKPAQFYQGLSRSPQRTPQCDSAPEPLRTDRHKHSYLAATNDNMRMESIVSLSPAEGTNLATQGGRSTVSELTELDDPQDDHAGDNIDIIDLTIPTPKKPDLQPISKSSDTQDLASQALPTNHVTDLTMSPQIQPSRKRQVDTSMSVNEAVQYASATGVSPTRLERIQRMHSALTSVLDLVKDQPFDQLVRGAETAHKRCKYSTDDRKGSGESSTYIILD